MKGCLRANEIERRDRKKKERRFGAPLGRFALAASLIGAVPGLAEAAAFPTCAQLGSSPAHGLVGNPKIVSGTLITATKPPAPPQPANIVPSPPFGGTSPTPTP